MLALKAANALLTIDIDGKEQLALAKDVQRDAIKPVIEHVDLVVVRRGEKVTVDVQVHVEGEAAPETVVTVENQTVELEVEATHIPESLEVSVEGLAAGTQIHASDLVLPEGATLVTDPEILVVNVTAGDLRRGAGGRARRGRGRGRHRARGARRPRPRAPRPLPRAPTRPEPTFPVCSASTASPMASTDPWLIVGLGNPGPTYAGNRHNVGAMVVDELAARASASLRSHKARAVAAEIRLGVLPGGAPGPKAVVATPLSYMNESGGPVAGLMSFFKIPVERLIVVHDELDIPFASVRLKRGGGEGGHNGLRSISKSVGTRDYLRVRVGIGRPPGRMDPAAFVLQGLLRDRAHGAAVPAVGRRRRRRTPRRRRARGRAAGLPLALTSSLGAAG